MNNVAYLLACINQKNLPAVSSSSQIDPSNS